MVMRSIPGWSLHDVYECLVRDIRFRAVRSPARVRGALARVLARCLALRSRCVTRGGFVIFFILNYGKGPLMATNMLHSIKHNIKHSTMVQCNAHVEMYIFGQVTRKQRHFETFDTPEIYNAVFEIEMDTDFRWV